MLNQTVLSYFLYRLAGAIMPFIPPRWGHAFFSFLGDLVYHVSGRAREIVEENLSHVLGEEGEEETDKVVRQVFRNSLKNYYELFHHSDSTQEIKITGLENMEEALDQGKGLVLATPHFGSPDGLMHAVPLLSLPVTAPAEHLKPEILFRYICSLRENRGITLLPADGPLLGLFRALRRNEIVVVAADRDTTESGIVVDFFGAPARLPDGHVQLAMRTGAKLALAFGRREEDNSFSVEISPLLELEESGDFKRDARANVEKVVATLEEIIRQNPDQWLMFYPIWRQG